MSERELIKDMKILLECTDMGGLQRRADVLIGRAIEILAQPEPRQDSHCYWCDGEYDAGARLAQLEQEPDLWVATNPWGVMELMWSEPRGQVYANYKVTKFYRLPPTREPLPELIFCVTAYRWGDREKHSYVVGVFDDLERAIQKAKGEKEWRAGKYDCEVISMPINTTTQNRKHTVEYKLDEGFENELQ